MWHADCFGEVARLDRFAPIRAIFLRILTDAAKVSSESSVFIYSSAEPWL